MKRPSETPLSAQQLRSIRRAVEETGYSSLRWQTVRDAIGDFPILPISVEHRCLITTNSVMEPCLCRSPGSKLDEPSKTIKAGITGSPAVRTW